MTAFERPLGRLEGRGLLEPALAEDLRAWARGAGRGPSRARGTSALPVLLLTLRAAVRQLAGLGLVVVIAGSPARDDRSMRRKQ